MLRLKRREQRQTLGRVAVGALIVAELAAGDLHIRIDTDEQIGGHALFPLMLFDFREDRKGLGKMRFAQELAPTQVHFVIGVFEGIALALGQVTEHVKAARAAE